MYTNHESKIAKAINEDSTRDRAFSYVVLFVISLVTVVMGYILWGLISSLTVNMESIASDMKSMRKDMNRIESIDTSNPIMASLEGIKYHDLGLDYKPTANMNNFQDINIENVNMELVNFNTKAFKSINEL